MRVLFDHGTIVLAEPPDLNLDFLPGVVWDPRVALHRAPARFHADIVRELERRGLPFTDEAEPRPSRFGSSQRSQHWHAIELRPYQTAALLAWDLAERRGVAVLPTGSGKTRLALAALAMARAPALCLVPTRILLRQWREELERVYAGSIGCLGDGERTIADLCVATFESAYRYMPKLGGRFEMMVIDEVHHFGNGIRDEALEMSTARFRLGLTATPPPDAAAQRLEELVGPTVYQLGVGDLAGRWLADLDRVLLRLPLNARERRIHGEHSRTFNSVCRAFRRSHPTASWQEFTAIAKSSPEGRAALEAWRMNRKLLGLTDAKRVAVAELLARHHASRVLVFTSDNEAAYAIAREHLAMPITCNISRSERADALTAFRNGDLRVLVSSRVLNEGIDVPDADIAIIVGGGSSEREYVQRVGRLLRPRPGKRALVYELITAGTTEARNAARRRRGLGIQSTSSQSL